MTSNREEIFDIPKKMTEDEERRFQHFNSIMDLANSIEPQKKPRQVKPKKEVEVSDEHKAKMLDNLQKGREKRKANLQAKKEQTSQQTPEVKVEVKQEKIPDVKPKEVIREVVKEVIKEVPIVDHEYEEWKKQKAVKKEEPKPEPPKPEPPKPEPPKPVPVVVPIPQPKLAVWSTFKRPNW